MSELQGLVESYLQSADYRLLEQRSGFVIADRLGLGGERDTWLVWVPKTPPLPEDYWRLESSLLGQFSTHLPQYPRAKCFVVLPTLEGFSQNFRSECRRLNVNLTVPIRFFDAPYKVDLSSKYTSAINTLIQEFRAEQRAPQPYVEIIADEEANRGEDLLSDLIDEIPTTNHPCLRVVMGQAGIGKSVFFQALFSGLFHSFIEMKNKLRVYPRPVPLIPAYFRRTASVRAAALVDEFLRTDVAAPVPRETFEWMLTNGYSTWLFDGLDELYAGDSEFFFYLLDFLTRSESRAQILLCARESLRTSCETFSEFLDEFPSISGDCMHLYRLESWELKSKRTYAWLRLEGRTPRSGERDTEVVNAFLDWTEASGTVRSLSGVPYYCSLLLDAFRESRAAEIKDDFSLIGHAVSAMLRREQDKGLVRPDDFEAGGLTGWLNEIAFYSFAGGFSGINIDDLKVYAEAVLRKELPDKEKENAITTLVQFPFFRGGEETGTITFQHELICEYLAGCYVLGRIKRDPAWAARSLGVRADLSDSLIARYIARNLPDQPGAIQSVAEALRSAALPGSAFSDLLQILLLADPRGDLVQIQRIILEARDLSYIRFTDRDLSRVSFRNCNLTSTRFVRCNLQAAHFEGAQLVGTAFEQLSEGSVKDATFGIMDRFKYVFVDGRKMEDAGELAEWINRSTGRTQEVLHPCPAAQQLRILFMKYIQFDGRGRRDDMKGDDLLRGRQVPEAPSPSACVEASRRFGYLSGGDRPGHIKRATGDRYGEMVQFVTTLSLSEDLKNLLNSICLTPACRHIPLSA